ncbi:TIGR01777 family oxidoreductase [Klugiella xanthotipulae]|uniref:TIGR01777 family protein n=1 Tax=Klugiella xanthotipulae TaxID=244735 RepID=A0A543HXT7_9MICO|nr:TIGR01777 family oxidoreductase [Klugiella xanthotipulae]TQM63156.1 hypothetical protein FB466_1410 [Klugiella xanthotipulae]
MSESALNGTTPRTLLISGSSGLIGRALAVRAQSEGYRVRTLVRRAAHNTSEFRWDPVAGLLDTAALRGVDAVVNLSGAPLNKLPWTGRYKKEIRQSRLDATGTLVQTMGRMDTPPATLLNASAVGYYGHRPGEKLMTSPARGTGFLADVCAEWEAAAQAAPPGVRVVTLRTGIVLSRTGGVLPLLERIARFGLAGPLGPGTQHWPWISLRDHVGAQLHLLRADVSGPVNLVGPEQVTAAQIVRAVATAVHRPYWLPAPRFALVGLLGDAARELLLSDQHVQARRLLESGYTFHDPSMTTLISGLYATR